MNAWLLRWFGCFATSIGRLHLVQKFLSAHDLLLIALAIETSETYWFLNSAMDSSVIRNILGAGLGLSHPNSTNRRMDLV